jgi:hypothetical protein
MGVAEDDLDNPDIGAALQQVGGENILQKIAPAQTTPNGVTRMDAIVALVLDVFLHEVGHAVFDYNKVPILGREEDAADQFAAYTLLKFDKNDARRPLEGVAYGYARDASIPYKKRPVC